MDVDFFCNIIGDLVKKHYELEDGADLCFNLMGSGVIPKDASIEEAMQIVAQHILQA